MKSIYNCLGKPVAQYLKKEIIKEGIKPINVFTEKNISSFNIKDKIDINLNKSEIQEQLFYKPSLFQQKQMGVNANSRPYVRQYSTMVKTMEKFGDPKNDFVFKKLFGNEKNKDLLIDFINKVLPDKHVKDIEYIPTNLEPDIRIKKQSILDVLCTDENDSKYIIEMQNAKEKGFEKRAVYYASKTYATQMDKGGKYADLKEVIFVAITDFVMFPNKKEYISTHSILDNKTHERDLRDFSFAFIELPKFKKQDGVEGVDKWCDLFKNAKALKSVNTTDPIMKKAYETLEISNWTEQELLDYQAYEKLQLDNQAREDQVRDEKAIEIARNLKNAKVDISIISKTTGLSEDQIKDL